METMPLTEIKYYDGSELLSKKDLNGNTPEIFISQTLRSKGKTTFFSHKLVEDFLTEGKKFGLIYRYVYEIEGCDKNLEYAVKQIYYPDIEIGSEYVASKKLKEIFINGESAGYGIPLNSYEAVKKNSNMLSEIEQLYFDEVLTEDDKYLPKEIEKFMSVHKSIARQPYQPVRYVPVYMACNKVRLLNPYYVALGIVERWQPRSKYLRGNGFVLEMLGDESLAKLESQSGFNQAFGNNSYAQYLQGNVSLYEKELNDIQKVPGEKDYMATLYHNGEYYGLWLTKERFYYVSKKHQKTFRVIYGVTIDDRIDGMAMDYGYIEVSRRIYERAYKAGCVRFENSECKQVFMNFLLTDKI